MQAYAQQARKWVEPDGRATYSDVPPSKTAPLVGSVKGDSQPAGAGEKIEAGKVELVEGQVSVTGADSKPRNILTGSILLEGDSVSTGEKGELHAEMADGAVIAVRPNSQIRIVRCRARGNSADTSALNLLKGSFRSVTCWIGKSSPANCQIRTPSAAIGVRGTDHEPLVIPAGAASGEPGTYDRVNYRYLEHHWRQWRGRCHIGPRRLLCAARPRPATGARPSAAAVSRHPQ